MRTVKVVVAGPFGAGKTTLIHTISQIRVLSTERSISDGARLGGKQTTTVALDFGRVIVAPDLALALYGTPDRSRFDFMWDVVTEGMLGFLLIADYSRPDSFREATAILDYFLAHRPTPFIVGINKGAGTNTEREIVAGSLGFDSTEGIVSFNAPERESVTEMLAALFGEVLVSLDHSMAV